MKLMGFNYTKINVEKYGDSFKGLKINSQVDISDIEEVKQEVFKSKDEFLAVKFRYKIEYTPDIALIDLGGNILVSVESKLAKNVIKQWKEKAMPDEFKIPLFNIIFRKAGLKAFQFEEEMNLPTHIQMPTLRKQEDSDKK